MRDIIQKVKNTPKTSEKLFNLGIQVAFELQTQSLENKQMMYELIGEELNGDIDAFIQGTNSIITDKAEQKLIIDSLTQITLYAQCLDNQLLELKTLPQTPEIKTMLSTLEELNNELKKRVMKKTI